MYGYMGNIFRINLSDRTVKKEPREEKRYQDFIGGRGLNSKILYDEIKPGIDPLGPENKIVIGAGPCNGTIVPGSCRFTISSKSPMTGLLGDSNSGGFFGAYLKYAGCDAVIIEGRSQEPVYLLISDGHAEIRDATQVWGMTTREATRAIQRELCDPDLYVVSIGPGGENGVRFANLITDLGRAAGRTGQGAVFGSKKVKAVVVRGTEGVKVAHPRKLEKYVRILNKAWKGQVLELKNRWGPAAGWTRYAEYGMFGTRNFQGGASWKRMREDLDDYFVRAKACFSCPAGCNHLFVIQKGPDSGSYGEGLELTTIDFGPKMGSEDLFLVAKLHSLLDEYGIDYFETTTLIAFATECFEKGILSRKDTDGLDLQWGDAKAAHTLIEKILHKEGIGAVLAEGVKRAAEAIGKGAEELAMQTKGQTFAGRDPRTSKGWGLGYAVASRGGCHVRAHLPEAYAPDTWDASVQSILAKYEDPTSPHTEEGKGELVKWHEDLVAVKNSIQVCLFALYPWMIQTHSVPDALSEFYYGVTGIRLTEKQLLLTGERIVNIERAFNIREGLTRKDDTLPERFLKDPYPDGPAKGQIVDLKKMLQDYYRFRDWDETTGFPYRRKLMELGLNDVAEDLSRMERSAA